MAHQEQPKIYYRPLHDWIDVTPEEKKNWERIVNSGRKAMQRKGACCVPWRKSYLCDLCCDDCEFRRKSEEVAYLSIEEENRRILAGESSEKGFISDKALVTEIDIDYIILKDLMKGLKSTNPEGYRILVLYAAGVPERECAKRMHLPRNTYVYKRNRLLEELKKKVSAKGSKSVQIE